MTPRLLRGKPSYPGVTEVTPGEPRSLPGSPSYPRNPDMPIKRTSETLLHVGGRFANTRVFAAALRSNEA